MNANACPCCGRALPKPRKAPAAIAPIDTARLSDAELIAHYKRTVALEDCRWHLARATAAGRFDRAAWIDLTETVIAQGGKHSAASKARYLAMMQALREYRVQIERDAARLQVAA